MLAMVKSVDAKFLAVNVGLLARLELPVLGTISRPSIRALRECGPGTTLGDPATCERLRVAGATCDPGILFEL
jgi:hypothetical protein